MNNWLDTDPNAYKLYIEHKKQHIAELELKIQAEKARRQLLDDLQTQNNYQEGSSAIQEDSSSIAEDSHNKQSRSESMSSETSGNQDIIRQYKQIEEYMSRVNFEQSSSPKQNIISNNHSIQQTYSNNTSLGVKYAKRKQPNQFIGLSRDVNINKHLKSKIQNIVNLELSRTQENIANNQAYDRNETFHYGNENQDTNNELELTRRRVNIFSKHNNNQHIKLTDQRIQNKNDVLYARFQQIQRKQLKMTMQASIIDSDNIDTDMESSHAACLRILNKQTQQYRRMSKRANREWISCTKAINSLRDIKTYQKLISHNT